jgi:hypothetical protein
MNGVPTYSVGQTGTLWDPDNMVALATFTVSPPTFSTTDGKGDTPKYGYFATFTITVKNIAPVSTGDTVDPSDSDFYVAFGRSAYGIGQPNAGASAAAEQENFLGAQVATGGLDPGQTTTGTVTIDVASQHGSLVYAPAGTPLGTWSF